MVEYHLTLKKKKVRQADIYRVVGASVVGEANPQFYGGSLQ